MGEKGRLETRVWGLEERGVYRRFEMGKVGSLGMGRT